MTMLQPHERRHRNAVSSKPACEEELLDLQLLGLRCC